MYGIYANIGDILMVNLTIYSIHGSYGLYIHIYIYYIIHTHTLYTNSRSVWYHHQNGTITMMPPISWGWDTWDIGLRMSKAGFPAPSHREEIGKDLLAEINLWKPLAKCHNSCFWYILFKLRKYIPPWMPWIMKFSRNHGHVSWVSHL